MQQGETVAEIGESIAQREEGATPEEAALVQAGVAQTLDASDAPSEVVDEVTEGVATESYGRITVSMEGFKDVLKRMWQATKEFVTRIVNAIKDTWRRFWNSTKINRIKNKRGDTVTQLLVLSKMQRKS